MATDDRDVLFRAQRLVDGGSPTADTLMENANLRTRIAALESQLDRYRWRRVEEEVPATSLWVLARHASSQLPYVKFWDASLSGVREATHWMPMPPAPEVGE